MASDWDKWYVTLNSAGSWVPKIVAVWDSKSNSSTSSPEISSHVTRSGTGFASGSSPKVTVTVSCAVTSHCASYTITVYVLLSVTVKVGSVSPGITNPSAYHS